MIETVSSQPMDSASRSEGVGKVFATRMLNLRLSLSKDSKVRVTK